MKELGRVNVLEGAEDLVHDILLVNLLQNVCADHRMKIRFHELKYEINVLIVLSLEHIQQPGRRIGKPNRVGMCVSKRIGPSSEPVLSRTTSSVQDVALIIATTYLTMFS